MKLPAALLSAAVVLVAPAAFACINGMKLEGFERKENLVAQASRAYRGGRYAEAATLADRGLATKPGDADRRALLRTAGLANLKLGNFDRSVEHFDALVKDKKEPFVQAKLSEAQLRRAEGKGTVDAEAKAVLDKLFADGLVSDADALVALARARARAGEVDAAKAAVAEALRTQPDHPEALELRRSLDAPKPKPSAEPVKPSSRT